jgi:plasmid stability protein
MTPEEALGRVLALTGLSLPRGVLGPETWALARALSPDADPGADPGALAGAAAAAHWPELRGPMQAALQRAAVGADPEDAEAFSIVLGWAADEDPDTPLARALAVRAATELARADARARTVLRAAEAAVAEGGPPAAVAASTAAGAIAADLLDLDPEDFAPEIAGYVAAGGRAEDIPELARATGDPEIRAWARSAVARTDDPDAPEASAGVRHLATGDPPEDPAADLVWVPTILALTQEAVERSLVDEASSPARGED